MLRGEVEGLVRQYSYAFDGKSRSLRLKAEVDRPLTEDEREDLAVAETEIYADFEWGVIEHIETEVSVVPAPQPLAPLEGGVLFVRDQDE